MKSVAGPPWRLRALASDPAGTVLSPHWRCRLAVADGPLDDQRLVHREGLAGAAHQGFHRTVWRLVLRAALGGLGLAVVETAHLERGHVARAEAHGVAVQC